VSTRRSTPGSRRAGGGAHARPHAIRPRAAILGHELAPLEELAGADVELGHEHAAPLVPDARPDAAHVGVGEHVEALQVLDAPARAAEVDHEPVVVDVAVLREVRHRQVLADQELRRRGLVLVEAEARPTADHMPAPRFG
jgi:hypothetical protein